MHVVWDASDEALVAGLAARDADAALAFVRRFQRRVFGCALAIVGDSGRAEDVAQEAFVRAWRHAAVYDGRRASVSTWLLTITRNLAIDSVRVERVRPADPVDLIDLTLVDPAVGPADLAARSSDVERVVGALRQLPVEQRRAVVLASVYGRTAQEISAIEDVPLGTAKTRLRTGLLKLRGELVHEVAE
jgi:RNA polymerase sigma factor (sigma-70 family)